MFTKNSQFAEVYGKRLGELMEEHGEKQQQLSEALGMKAQSVSTYRKGISLPDTRRLIDIADHYGVSIDWMLGLTDVREDAPKLREVCQITGLSPKAIEQLERDKGRAASAGAFVDYLLSDESACAALSWAFSNAGTAAEKLIGSGINYDIVARSIAAQEEREGIHFSDDNGVTLPPAHAFLFYIGQAMETIRNAVKNFANFV